MDELERIRSEYDRRARDPRYRLWYSRFNAADIYLLQERERQVLQLLAEYTDENWSNFHVLEIGSGDGHQLSKFVAYGLGGKNLTGIELLFERASRAKTRYPHLQFVCGDGAVLPYGTHSFDLVFQFTVFTSILDKEMRRRMAAEMMRVLKPRGLVLWYDYRLNPTNPQTRGIERDEIVALFPNCEYVFRRITLAPPIARKIAPRSWFACAVLSQLPFLKTHYLALIRKKHSEASV